MPLALLFERTLVPFLKDSAVVGNQLITATDLSRQNHPGRGAGHGEKLRKCIRKDRERVKWHVPVATRVAASESPLKKFTLPGSTQATQSEARICLFNQALRMNLSVQPGQGSVLIELLTGLSQWRKTEGSKAQGHWGAMGFPCNWSREVLEVSGDQDYRAQYYGKI